jgi:hypothetical protein
MIRTVAASLAVALLAVAPAALAEEAMGKGAPAPAEPANPRLDRLKALAGGWHGTARAGPDKVPGSTRATIKEVSAGSAVMLVTDPGTEHEMVTLFHPDDGALLATHYCAARNQPRMRATGKDEPGKLTFEFVDGTNLKTHPARMDRLVITVPDADHHLQEWTFRDDGKTQVMTFEMVRD